LLEIRSAANLVTWTIPAVSEFSAHFLQVRIAHVFDCENENVLVVVRGLLDIGKELQRELLALLVRLGEVYDLRALGFGHIGGIVGEWCCMVGAGEKFEVAGRNFQKNERGILANHRLAQPRLNSAVDLSRSPMLDSSDFNPIRAR